MDGLQKAIRSFCQKQYERNVTCFCLSEETERQNNVVYGSVILYSPREQETRILVGSEGHRKIWLNGTLIHELLGEPAWDYDSSYDQFLPVTLKQGANVLLVAVDNGYYMTGHFAFEEGTEYTVLNASDITIPDPNLRAAIAETLDKEDANAPITLQEMATLTILRASNRDIKDLTGIEFAINLEELWISKNPVSDISPLSKLTNLVGLGAWETPISDLSPLSGLKNLRWLDFVITEISDLTPLAGLTSLRKLTCYNSGDLADISPLAGLTGLTFLSIGGNRAISDASPIAGLINLEHLDLHSDSISDLSPLAGLIELKHLNLFNNRLISDLSPLSELKGLTYLELDRNNISDVSPLSELKGLTYLELDRNNISDVSPLTGLINLEWLSLRENLISDISILEGLSVFPDILWVENPGSATGGPIIEGPWLWLKLPAEHLNKDWLAAASDSAVTEEQIATYGTADGKSVGNSVWKSAKIDSDYNNINRMLDSLGEDENRTYHVIYGSIVLDSPQEQKTMMLQGNFQFSKIWLNGELVYKDRSTKNARGPRNHDYGIFFPVTLKQGINVLLVAVQHNREYYHEWNGFFGFEEGTEYTVLNASDIVIPDPNLRATIAEALDKEDANAPITLQDMATLTILRASNRDIKDLTGIEFAVNLEELWISENPISDLAPLTGLKNLIGLGAWDNPNISDLSPLVKLPKLRWLDFGLTPVSDLSPLADIKSLRKLTFQNGGIKDISQLAGLTQLTFLDIAYNWTIPDLSPITKLTNLEIFVANSNDISDITPLAALTDFRLIKFTAIRFETCRSSQ